MLVNSLLKIEKWISQLVNLYHNLLAKIGHLHVSDNHGKKDDHLPIGEGGIGFRKIISALKQAGYDDTVTLEVFSEDRNKLKTSQERFAALHADC